MDDNPTTPTQPKNFPLVCPAELLNGAEARINAVPHLGYDWAIRYADRPLKLKPAARRPVDRSELQARYYERRHQHAARRAW
jgi:hypothetical protein